MNKYVARFLIAMAFVVGLLVGCFAYSFKVNSKQEEIMKRREIELSQSIVCYEYEVNGYEIEIDIEDVNVNVEGCKAW